MTSRRVTLVVVAIVLLGAGTWTVARWGDYDETDGPLDGGEGVRESQPVAVASPYTFGSVLLRNLGDTPAIIEKVRLLGVAGPLRLLGVHTRPVPDEQGRGLSGGEDVFPPVDYPTKPLSQLNVVPVPKTFTPEGTPGEGIQVFFGLEVTKAGIGRSREVEVTYRVGGRRYREVYDRTIFMCAPAERYEDMDSCLLSDEDADFGERTLP